jgi:hypothetical protein
MTKPRDLATLGGGFTQTGTGAIQRTVENKLKDTVSVKDFGAVGDGVADDTAAIQAALVASTNVYFPPGLYNVNTFTVTHNNFLDLASGAIINVIAGQTLTLQDTPLPQIDRQLFTPTSNVLLAGESTGQAIFAAWWGCSYTSTTATNKTAILAAINAAFRGVTIRLPAGDINLQGDIQVTKPGIKLTGTAGGSSWGGYGLPGTSLYFTSGSAGFILTGTQYAVGIGVSDASCIENLELKTFAAVPTAIQFKGPKYFKNLRIDGFKTCGIECLDYGIGFDIDNCVFVNIGNNITDLGKAIRVAGNSTTTFSISNCKVSFCYNGFNIEAGLNYLISNCIIESCGSQYLQVTGGTAGFFVNCWLEDNGYSIINDYLITVSGSAVDSVTFDNCRYIGEYGSNKDMLVGGDITGTVRLLNCRSGTTSQYYARTIIERPIQGCLGTGLYEIVRSEDYKTTYKQSGSDEITLTPTLTKNVPAWQTAIKTVTVSSTGTGSSVFSVNVGLDIGGANGYSVASFLVGGRVNDGQYQVVEVSRNNTGVAVISSVTKIGGSFSFTLDNPVSANATAVISVTGITHTTLPVITIT